jgi:IS605 OrfB family transposase
VREIATICFKTEAKSRLELHRKLYYSLMKQYSISAQLMLEALWYGWNAKKTADQIRDVIVRFDQNLSSFRDTKRGNPVVTVRTNEERIGLPIRQDGAYHRLLVHMAEGWAVGSVLMKRDRSFLVCLKKGIPNPPTRPNVLGVDANAGSVAVSILTPQKRILRQLYLARDIEHVQIRFTRHRAKLRSYRDGKGNHSKASMKLKKLGKQQHDYVQTNMWLLAKQLCQIAREYHANIAIEHLRHLRKKTGQMNKKARKRINRIPYGLLRLTLQHKAPQMGIQVFEVRPAYTSQTCPKCGHRAKANRKRRLFRCQKCGFTANVDRVASVNIGLRAIQNPVTVANRYGFNDQDSQAGASFNRLVKQDEAHSWSHPEMSRVASLNPLNRVKGS